MGPNNFVNRTVTFPGVATTSGKMQIPVEDDNASILQILEETQMLKKVSNAELFPIIYESFFYEKTSKNSFKIVNCWHVQNDNLIMQYLDKKEELDQVENKVTGEYYAFETIEDENQLYSILKNGVQIGNTDFCILGNPKKGVVLKKYVDVLADKPLYGIGKLMVYKVMLGKSLNVSEEISNMMKDPAIGYDSHTSNSLTSVLKSKNHSEVFKATQIYLYEYDAGGLITRGPRQVYPYAVVEYANIPSKLIPHQTMDTHGHIQLNVWEGKLYSDQHFIGSVVLKSSFLKLQFIEFLDDLRISSSITIAKLDTDYLADYPVFNPCKETYKPRTTGAGLNYATCFQLMGGSKTSRCTTELRDFISKLQREEKAAVVEIKDAKAFLLPQCSLTTKRKLPVFNDIESKTSLHVILMSPSTMEVEHSIMTNRESKIEKLVSDFGRISIEPRFLSSREAMCDAFRHQRHPDSSAREVKSPILGISDARICAMSRMPSLDLPIPEFGLEKSVQPERTNESLLATIDEKLSDFSIKYKNTCGNKSPSPEFQGMNISTSSTFLCGNDKPLAFSSANKLLNDLLQDVQQDKKHESCAPCPGKLHATDNHVSDTKMLDIEEELENIHNATDNLQSVDMEFSPESEKMEDDVSIESGECSETSSPYSLSDECPPLPPPCKSPPLPPLPQSPPPRPANKENIGLGQATNDLGAYNFAHEASNLRHRRKRSIQDDESSHHEVPNKSPRVDLVTKPCTITTPVSPSEYSDNATASIQSQSLQNSGSTRVIRHTFVGAVPQLEYPCIPLYPVPPCYPASVQSPAAVMDPPPYFPAPPFSNASGYRPGWTNNAISQMPINHQSHGAFPRLGSQPVHCGLVANNLPQQVISNQFASPPRCPIGPPPLPWAYCQPPNVTKEFVPSFQRPNIVPVPCNTQPAKEYSTNNNMDEQPAWSKGCYNGTQMPPISSLVHSPSACSEAEQTNPSKTTSSMSTDQHRNPSQSQLITAEYQPVDNFAGNMPGKLKRPLASCTTSIVDILSNINGWEPRTAINSTAQKTADAFKIEEPPTNCPANDKPRNCGVFHIVHKDEIITESELFKNLPLGDRVTNVKRLVNEVQLTLPNVIESVTEDLHHGAPSITDVTNEQQLDIIHNLLVSLLVLGQTRKKENPVASS